MGPCESGRSPILIPNPSSRGLADLLPEAELSLDYPSRLAEDLEAGQLDVALVPSIEVLRHPDYEIVSDACVATRGPVMSVKLYSRVPMGAIQIAALDAGSRTSAALTRIMLAERFGVASRLGAAAVRAFVRLRPRTDAVLLIGDRAMHAPAERFAATWDLGEEWLRWTGLPFVFAVWAAKGGTDLGPSKRHWAGRAIWASNERRQIAQREAPRSGNFRVDCIQLPKEEPPFSTWPGRTQRIETVFRDWRPGWSWPREERTLSSAIAPLLEKAVDGERLTPEEGLRLIESHDLVALGRAADAVTKRLHPEPFRTYNIDRNINYTNECAAVCDFCAFYRPPGHEEVYVLPRDVLVQENRRDGGPRRRPDPDARRPARQTAARVV